MEDEIYKSITDYEGIYSISHKGNVRNDKRKTILKPCLDNHGYYIITLSKNGDRKTFKIHRLIAIHFIDNPENKQFVDHIDIDKTNNSISNLRWVTRSENGFNTGINRTNTSGIKGVSFDKKTKKWRVRIKLNQKSKHLGLYETLEEATLVRQEAALKYFGDFCNPCEKII